MIKLPSPDPITEAAALARADQVKEMARLEATGDAFAAYWAASASASVAHHVRRGAVRTVRAGGAR